MRQCIAAALLVGLWACPSQPDCVFDLSQCSPPQRNAVEIPPAGALRLHYKGCMQTCGAFASFHPVMPQGECGGDISDECSYAPLYGEPDPRTPLLEGGV